MAKNKRLERFETLGLIDKLKVIKVYLTSPRFAVQLRGMQKMEDCLSQMSRPNEREYFLGLVTGAFVHKEQIRQRAAHIMRYFFPERWKYIGLNLNDFYESPQSKNLKTIVRKALNLLEQPEIPLQVINIPEALNYFQPNHRHGLDLLLLGVEAGIFSLPHEFEDTNKTLFIDFVRKDFLKDFPNAEIGGSLRCLFQNDQDPFVLRRILDFFGKTALPIENNIEAFDTVLEMIQPPDKSIEYMDNPHAYYQVIQYGIRSAIILYAKPWYQSVRDILSYPHSSGIINEDLIEITKKCRNGYWPKEQDWQALLKKCKVKYHTISENLEKAYLKIQKNRYKLGKTLREIIRLQNNYKNKPDQRKDINRKDAIEALGKIGDYRSLLELRTVFGKGLQCKSVSYTLQSWHYVLTHNLRQFELAQRQEIIQHFLSLGRSKKKLEGYIASVLGKIQAFPTKKEWNELVRFNAKYVNNYLITLYTGRAKGCDRNLMLRESMQCYKNFAASRDTNDGFELSNFVHLWDLFLTADHKSLPKEQRLLPELIEELRNIIQDELRLAPDRTTLINLFKQFAFLIKKLNLSEALRLSLPTDDEIIKLKGEGAHLRLIKDPSILKDAFERETKPARKLFLWLELIIRHPQLPYLDCPFDSQMTWNKALNLIDSIEEYCWIEGIPALMRLPIRDVPGLLDLLKWLLRDTRSKPQYGFSYGGLNKYVRQHLSEEAAYYLYEEWLGETEMTDAEIAKFAWLNLLRAAEYANKKQLPFPRVVMERRFHEPTSIVSRLASVLTRLDYEDTLSGTVESGNIYLHDIDSSYQHSKMVFVSPLLDTQNVWRIVTQKPDFPLSIMENIKNYRHGKLTQRIQKLNIGDCVIGIVERLIKENSHEKFIVDLGEGYPKGVWSEFDIGEARAKKLSKFDQHYLFMIAAEEQNGNLILSRKAFIATFKELLLKKKDYLEMEVIVDEIHSNGNLRVLCGHLPFEISAKEITWANPEAALKVIAQLKERQDLLRICLVRPDENSEVYLSLKRLKPAWGTEELAMFFGIHPFTLTFVETEKNDLVFEVNASFPEHFVRPGTLCKVNAERLVDKDGFNFHPLLAVFPPKCGETFAAKWLLPIMQENSKRPWQQEGEAVLQISRVMPYRYDLHNKFSINSHVTIVAKPEKLWADKPQTVEIIKPKFEDQPVPAILAWDQADPTLLEHLTEVNQAQKLRAKIIKYQDCIPLVVPTTDEFSKFKFNEWYPLKIVGKSKEKRRNYLILSHWATKRKLVINEDQLGYNPEIMLDGFPKGITIEARYLCEKNGEFNFSLLHTEVMETICSVEHQKQSIEGIYLGYQVKGYEEYIWIEREPGSCLRIARKCFDFFQPNHLEIGDRVVVKPVKNKNAITLVPTDHQDSGRIRKLLAQNLTLRGVMISKNNDLVKIFPNGLRPMVGRLVADDQQQYWIGKWLAVKIDRIWMKFFSGVPKLRLDLFLIVDHEARLGIEDLFNEWKDHPKMQVCGRVEAVDTDGLRIKVSKYDSDIKFLVPYKHVSKVPSRRDYQYYQSVANPWLVRNFQVLGVDDKEKLVTLSLRKGNAKNLKRNGELNPELGIDKGEACLIGISLDAYTYYFETATLVICRVNSEDIQITEDQRRLYLNLRFIGGMFNFEIHNNQLTLKAQPTCSLEETIKAFKNCVFLCRLSKEEEKWRINFVGKVVKKYRQLQHIQAFLAPKQEAQILAKKISEHDIVSVVFERYDKDQEAAYFSLWKQQEHQRNEIEVRIRAPKDTKGSWEALPQGTPPMPLYFDHVTAASSLKFFGLISPLHPLLHIGTLNFNPGEWYRAMSVKYQQHTYLSLTECEAQEVGSLDQFFTENPNETSLVFTLLRDVQITDKMILVERLPGMNYRIPLSRFDHARKLNYLCTGDRFIARVKRFDNISYQWEIEMILSDNWLHALYPQKSQLPQPDHKGYIADFSFTFKKWNSNRDGFEVHYLNKDEDRLLLLQLSALSKEQRQSFLWLKAGDCLHGRLMIAHEGLRYSEHGVFHVTRVEIGSQHEFEATMPLQTGSVTKGRIVGIYEDGYSIEFDQGGVKTGFLLNEEAKCLTRRDCNRDELLGLDIIVLIINAGHKFEVSYDRYLSERLQNFAEKSLLPGIVERACMQGAFLRFPGFISFIPYRELLHGYFGKGTLPKGLEIYCRLSEWHPQEGRVVLSHIVIPDELAQKETVEARIVFKDVDYLLVHYAQSYGVVSVDYVPRELYNSLEIEHKVFLRDFQIEKNRRLSVRRQTSLVQKQKIAWYLSCQYFPAWVDLVWTNLWDRRNQSESFKNDWLVFGSQLSNLEIPMTSTTVTAVARFLATPSRQLHLFSAMPEVAKGDWEAFLLAMAKIIINPQFYAEEQNPLVILATTEYFLSYKEYISSSELVKRSPIDWKSIYLMLNYLHQKLPGILNVTIGLIIAARLAKVKDVDYAALVKEVVQRLGSHFELFLQPYWPNWKQEIENHAVDINGQKTNPLERYIPGKLDDTVKKINGLIREAKTKPGLKIGRLHYLLACIYFVMQREEKVMAHLEEAENNLSKESKGEDQYWRRRIELLQLCMSFLAGRLHERRTTNVIPEKVRQDDFIERLKRYCSYYQPERESEQESIIFSAGLAAALKDYRALSELLEKSKNPHSFLMPLFQDFLDSLTDQMQLPKTLNSREPFLKTGQYVPKYLIE